MKKKKIYRIMLIMMICTSVFSGFGHQYLVHAQDDSQNVDTNSINEWMPDATLQTIVAARLGISIDEITIEKMSELKILIINASSSVASLKGLEYAVNLNTLNLGTNLIQDFSVIENMTKLTYLGLRGSTLTDENFPMLPDALVTLDISGSSVTNESLEKLSSLSNLVSFVADNNMRITSIAALASIDKLERISVQFCGVTDFTVVTQFKNLTYLAAYGQNTGRYDSISIVDLDDVVYSEEAETLFIPFSLMPNRLTNFDGYIPPFILSNLQTNTYFDLNGEQLEENRISISEDGITINNLNREEFAEINTFKYNARLDNVSGTYNTPDGYSFYSISSGTYLHSFQLIQSYKGGDVTVRYVDENNKDIADETILSGYVGDPYAVEAKEITGYTLLKVIGSESGNFTAETQAVIYVYSENTIEGGDVTVRYVDENNKDIADETILSGYVGDPYAVEAKEITGYTLLKVIGSESGNFTAETQAVIYVYSENAIEGGDVTVRYVDEDNKDIADEIILSGYVGDSYTVEAKEITGYTLLKVIGSESGNFTAETQAVIYVYSEELINDGLDENQTGNQILPNTGIEVDNIGSKLILIGLSVVVITMIKRKRVGR